MKREEGYYWICINKKFNSWAVGEWFNDQWFIQNSFTDTVGRFKDSDFEEIDERKIEREL